MRATEVTAHYERKLNTGDYSSVTLAAWAKVELEEGDEAEAGLAYAMDLCRQQVKEAAAPFIGKSGVSSGEQFAGANIKGGNQ